MINTIFNKINEKYNKEHILIAIILFFSFQRAIIAVVPFLKYFDELFTIIAFILILNKVIKNRSIVKNDKYIYILSVILLIEGLISNLLSGVLTNIFPICIDIISIFKIFICYLWMKEIQCDKDYIISKLAKFGRIIIIFMAICIVISQFIDIGMSDHQIRYGIRGFEFVFNNAGNYSKFFYFLIPLLIADLNYGDKKKKIIFIIIACICWMFSLRSRAFSFIALFFGVSMIFYAYEKNLIKFKIKWYHVLLSFLIIGGITILLSWKQLVFYFTTPTQARSILLKYSLITLAKFLPIGAGFGTYGSDVAATYYSKLYIEYGFNLIHGMGKTSTIYLNDNYWPMIFGQFGIIGTIIVTMILALIHKEILTRLKDNKYYLLSSICATLFLIISSVASKSYSEFSSICIFLLLGLMQTKKGKEIS